MMTMPGRGASRSAPKRGGRRPAGGAAGVAAGPAIARLAVRVQPGARRREVAGWLADGALKLRVTEPPEDGRANRAVEALLAGSLAVPVSRVRVTRGASSRAKTVEIGGLDEATVRMRLAAAGERDDGE